MLKHLPVLAYTSHTCRVKFSNVDETAQSNVFYLLGQMACVKTNSIQLPAETRALRSMHFYCSTCDGQSPRKPEHYWLSESESEGLMKVLEHLIKLPQVQKLGRSRAAAILASKRVLNHCKESTYLDLATSFLGQYCLQALRSSSRDVRIAAGYSHSPMLYTSDFSNSRQPSAT